MNKLSEYQIELIDQTIDELLDDANFIQEDQGKKLERVELALKLRDFRDGPKDHLFSPVREKQTQRSAAEISRKMRDGLKTEAVLAAAREADGSN
jgi:hypothetical protein